MAPRFSVVVEEGRPTLPLSSIARALLPLLKPYARLIATFTAATAARTALNVVLPLAMGALVDAAVRAALGDLALYSLAFLALIGGLWVVGYARTYSVSLLGQSFARDIRNRMVESLLRARIEELKREEVGRIVSKVTNDVDTISGIFTGGLVDVIADSAALVVSLAVMASISPQLTAVLVPLLPVAFAINYYLASKARRAFRAVRRSIATIASKVEQEVSGALVTRSFYSRRKAERAEFERVGAEYAEASVQATRIVASARPAIGLVRAAGVAAILYFGGELVSRGAITVGALVAFYGYLESFFRPLETLAVFFNNLQSALAASERVVGVLSMPREDEGGGLEPSGWDVEFRSVTFGYELGRPVLKGVSLAAKPGEVVGIVGPTGSGKSTLAKLLVRFYDPWEGVISLGGRDVREYRLESLRKTVVYVPQEPVVFSGTVLDNLRMARPGASRGEVEQLIDRLGLREAFASLPSGLDTYVVEEGRNLSKGQRQLVSLVRALLAKPRVLVLDESTSSVDPETELRVHRALYEMARREGMTLIVIAHRLAPLAHADRVYVLNRGEVVEAGTHAELLSKGGLYARLWRAQYPEDPSHYGGSA